MRGKVLIAAPVHDILTDGLIDRDYELIVREKITQNEAKNLLKGCTGIVTSTRLIIDRELLDSAPDLKWVGRMGSGMEIIDLEYAKSKGITCFSSPEGNRNAVAEHAMGMLLSLTKKIRKSSNEVIDGKWLRDENRGEELEGKNAGIIGFGHAGSCFAKKLAAFDVKIYAYDSSEEILLPEYVERCPSLEKIFETCDIISFHVPLTNKTVHYMDKTFVERMRKPFILINTSRGKVVDTEALSDGLSAGKISGACLDVWEEEPITAMTPRMKDYLHKISQLDQVIITPHIAGYSHEALYKMSKVLLDRIVMLG
ncbi:MAG: hydroxyacid dehydrogenase [Chitinophagaceae bacterium]|nr:hydroxyacid dehydrogenase [Chitinophagaceae bacterium]